jgi:hypothetical protein
MICINCGGSFEKRKGDLKLPDAVIGELFVRDVHYLRCSKCRDILIPARTAREIERLRDQRIGEFVNAMPISNFITSAKAAKILGITRQAFHKNRSIRNGLIYSSTITGKQMYVRESTIRFKDKGDGRFPLQVQAKAENILFIRQADTILLNGVWGTTFEPIPLITEDYTLSRGANANASEN